MKNRIEKTKSRRVSESAYQDFSNRLNQLIQKLGLEKKDFAIAGEIAPQTLTGYLDGTSQPKQEVLSKWFKAFKVNLNWLVAGYGEMFIQENECSGPLIPKEELSKSLTAEQRNMLTYKRLQTELGTSKERIADGIDAIVMGKCVSEKTKTEYGMSEERGLGAATDKVQEEGAGFGE